MARLCSPAYEALITRPHSFNQGCSKTHTSSWFAETDGEAREVLRAPSGGAGAGLSSDSWAARRWLVFLYFCSVSYSHNCAIKPLKCPLMFSPLLRNSSARQLQRAGNRGSLLFVVHVRERGRREPALCLLAPVRPPCCVFGYFLGLMCHVICWTPSSPP